MDTGGDQLQRAAAASEAALAPYAILGTDPEPAYDDLVQLAADLCDAPVALVTLFETSRQWFKAKVGFDGSETTLGDALCANAIQVDELLVIPDLTTDPRTRDNNLVTGGPQLGFYAGAPLRTPDGTFLGTLCVIDFAPRPAGLTEAQESGLKALARQVMASLELRRLLNERDAALVEGSQERGRLASSEAHWRGLFEGMREGFMVGEAVRNAAGRIVDWRHVMVNAAFLKVSGLTADQVIGRTARELSSAIPQLWIDFIGRVVHRQESATFESVPGAGGRLYDGRTFPIGEDRFAVMFVDVTKRVAAERRQAALIAIADHLRDGEGFAEVAPAVARIVGELLGVARTGFGRVDAKAKTIAIADEWMANGVASIAGLHRYADYGDLLLADLLAGEPLVIEDVMTDPRTASDPEPMLSVGVHAQVQIPLRERGRTMASFFIHASKQRRWRAEELAFLREVADRLEVAVARLELERRRMLQTQELSHRVKNTLAMVQAISSQTLKPVTEREAVATFEHRLTALATAHDVLLGSDWTAAPLDQVIGSVLDSLGQSDRVALAGPAVDLSPRATLSTSLLIHELTTNALKYGALSVSEGRVRLVWTIRTRDGQPTLFLDWTESGGPLVTAPIRRGFGSRLINMGLVGTGGVDLDYRSQGLVARMSAPLDDLTKQ